MEDVGAPKESFSFRAYSVPTEGGKFLPAFSASRHAAGDSEIIHREVDTTSPVSSAAYAEMLGEEMADVWHHMNVQSQSTDETLRAASDSIGGYLYWWLARIGSVILPRRLG